MRADGVEHGNGEQGRAHAMAADIQQVDRQVIPIEPVIAESIATKLGAGLETPFCLHHAQKRSRQE